MNFRFWFLHPFGYHFGAVLGAQMESKAIKKPPQKNIKNMMLKMTPNWSQRGSQNGAKIVKNEVLEASCFKDGSQVASRDPPGSILERFWDHFGTMLVNFLTYFCDFCMHSVAACCKQKHSKSQGITKRMQQRASKKQLLSSCHLALKSSLANVNELSGPC